MDVGAYVHLYGREFVHTDVRLALEYFLAAARLQGDSPAARGRLLRELLTESRAYGEGLGVTARHMPGSTPNTRNRSSHLLPPRADACCGSCSPSRAPTVRPALPPVAAPQHPMYLVATFGFQDCLPLRPQQVEDGRLIPQDLLDAMCSF